MPASSFHCKVAVDLATPCRSCLLPHIRCSTRPHQSKPAFPKGVMNDVRLKGSSQGQATRCRMLPRAMLPQATSASTDERAGRDKVIPRSSPIGRSSVVSLEVKGEVMIRATTLTCHTQPISHCRCSGTQLRSRLASLKRRMHTPRGLCLSRDVHLERVLTIGALQPIQSALDFCSIDWG